MISKYSSIGKKKISFSPLEQLKCVCGKVHRYCHISYSRVGDIVMCQDWELKDQEMKRIKKAETTAVDSSCAFYFDVSHGASIMDFVYNRTCLSYRGKVRKEQLDGL